MQMGSAAGAHLVYLCTPKTYPSDLTHDACILNVYTDEEVLHLVILPRDDNFALVLLLSNSTSYIFNIPEH